MINFVYVTTNLINGKQYVGDHSTQNVNDTYFGSGRIFLKALKKYGKENFTREILKIYNTRLEAYIAQEYYINLYNTLYPLGYNISPKGGHEVKGSVSEFTKEKISLKQKGISKRLYFIKKFGEDGEKKYLEYLQKTKNRKPLNCKGKGIKNRMIEKYGEIIGIKKYQRIKPRNKSNQ